MVLKRYLQLYKKISVLFMNVNNLQQYCTPWLSQSLCLCLSVSVSLFLCLSVCLSLRASPTLSPSVPKISYIIKYGPKGLFVQDTPYNEVLDTTRGRRSRAVLYFLNYRIPYSSHYGNYSLNSHIKRIKQTNEATEQATKNKQTNKSHLNM